MADSGRLDELQRKFEENPRRFFAPLANELRKAGNIERAIELCQEYLPHQPGHMSGYIVYGQALFDGGRHPEANEAFQQALVVDPENIIALRYLGDIARYGGDRDTATAWYRRVSEIDPKNEDVASYLSGYAPDVVSAVPPAPSPPLPTVYPEPVPDPDPVALGELVEQPDVVLPVSSHDSVAEVPMAFADEHDAREGEDAGVEEARAVLGQMLANQSPALQGASVEAEPEAVLPLITEFTISAYAPQVLHEQPLADLAPAEPVTPELWVIPEFPVPGGVIPEQSAYKPPEPAMSESVVPEPDLSAPAVPESVISEPVIPEAVVPSGAELAVPFVTETMAELYLQQGFTAQALDVYRRLAQGGDEPRLLEKIRELELSLTQQDAATMGAPSPHAFGRVTVRDFFARIGARRPSGASGAAASPAPGHGIGALFDPAQVEDADMRAASTLASAYTTVR